MQEKDIKEQLNQELDKMAPDILEKGFRKTDWTNRIRRGFV